MSFWNKIKFFMSEAWAFIKPFVTQLLTDSGQILARSAMSAVAAIAADMSAADGKTKRDAAFDMILGDLKAHGIELATSTINAALEAAVVKLKAEAR